MNGLNIITNPGTTRHIQPADFSFLSETDQLIVESIAAILKLLYGINSAVRPVVLSGLVATDGSSTSGGQTFPVRTFTAGVVLFNNKIYRVPAATLNVLAEAGSDACFLALSTDYINTEPSPVYDENFEKTIYCHKTTSAQLTNSSAVDDCTVVGESDWFYPRTIAVICDNIINPTPL